MFELNDEGDMALSSSVDIEPTSFSTGGKFHSTPNHLLLRYASNLFIFEVLSGDLTLVSQNPLEPSDFAFREIEVLGDFALSFSTHGSEPIGVHQVNLAPEIGFTSIEVEEDSEFVSEKAFNDPENDDVDVMLIEIPEHGSIRTPDEGLSYTPDPNYEGNDSFVIQGLDKHGNFSEQEILVTVTPVNDSPELITQSITLLEDTFAEQALQATDEEGDAIIFHLVSQPTNGTAQVSNAGNLVYRPQDNFFGEDQFSVRLSDPEGAFSEAVVQITVFGVNDPPVLTAQVFSSNEDERFQGAIQAFDIEGDTLEFTVIGLPQNGELTAQSNGNFSYMPNANFNGIDTFSMIVDDGEYNSSTVEMTIEVAPVNDPPSLISSVLSVKEDTLLMATLEASDPENDDLLFTLLSQAENGFAEINPNGDVSYTPKKDFNGRDTLIVGISDISGLSSTGTLTLDIEPVNDLPVLISSEFEHNEDTVLVVNLDARDIDSNTLSFSLVDTDYSEGSLTLTSSGELRFTPNLNFNGNFLVGVEIADSSLETANGSFSITTLAVDDEPNVPTQTFSARFGGVISNSLPTEDVDGETLNYTLVEAPTNGNVELQSKGEFTYSPNSGFFGNDTFSFNVSDGVNTTAGEVNLTISSPRQSSGDASGSSGGSTSIWFFIVLVLATLNRRVYRFSATVH